MNRQQQLRSRINLPSIVLIFVFLGSCKGLKESNFIREHTYAPEPPLLTIGEVKDHFRKSTWFWYLGSDRSKDYFKVYTDKYGKYTAVFTVDKVNDLPFSRIEKDIDYSSGSDSAKITVRELIER